jgi:two-component system nitrate/nitrite response regulator NarL
VDKTRILIVDDHTILRQGIGKLLNVEPDLAVGAGCSSVGEALLIVAAGLADVVLLDIDLGGERGTDFLAQARLNGFTGPVLVLTAGIRDGERRLLEAQGVAAVLQKDATVDQLASHIRLAVGRAGTVAAPSPSLPEPEAEARTQRFTPREARVLGLVLEGLSNKLIAAELNSTETAIKFVVQQLFRKTGTHTRAQLVRAALEQHRGEW